MIRCLVITGILAVILLQSACGQKPKERLPVTPVSGKLTVAGKAVKQVELQFHPKTPLADPLGKILAPSATTNQDGTFAPSTYDSRDGLPPGEYAITAEYPARRVDQGETLIGPDTWKGKHNNPKQPLKTITVGEQPLEIPTINVN